MDDVVAPAERKILSDILGLVLDDSDGLAGAALAQLRSRARRSHVTGGALKNAFQRLAGHPAAGDAASELMTLRRMQRARWDADRLRGELNAGGTRLAVAESTAARLQVEVSALRQRCDALQAARRRARIFAAAMVLMVVAGAAAGLAGRQSASAPMAGVAAVLATSAAVPGR